MATNPDGQSCATCAFYITGECRASKPSAAVDKNYYARPGPDSWCTTYNVWPGKTPPAAVGAACTSGTAAPSGGTDGDFYVRYAVSAPLPSGNIVALSIYQRQSGAWVVIQTIL